MKIILVIRQSLDGIISRQINDGKDWGSDKDKTFFESKVKEVGAVIMGKDTYEKTKISHPQILNGSKVLVFSHKKIKNKKNITFYDGDVNDGVNFFQEQGISCAVLIGGGNLNTQFLKSKLVDELFVTLSGRIFAQKVRVFGENALDIKLKLQSVKRLSKNELLLHYIVIK